MLYPSAAVGEAETVLNAESRPPAVTRPMETLHRPACNASEVDADRHLTASRIREVEAELRRLVEIRRAILSEALAHGREHTSEVQRKSAAIAEQITYQTALLDALRAGSGRLQPEPSPTPSAVGSPRPAGYLHRIVTRAVRAFTGTRPAVAGGA